jgi:hypothetical protein
LIAKVERESYVTRANRIIEETTKGTVRPQQPGEFAFKAILTEDSSQPDLKCGEQGAQRKQNGLHSTTILVEGEPDKMAPY